MVHFLPEGGGSNSLLQRTAKEYVPSACESERLDMGPNPINVDEPGHHCRIR